MGTQQDEPTQQEIERARQKFQRTETLVRRIGYVVLFGGGLVLVIPLLIGVIQGLQHDQVWDPFTGDPAVVDAVELDCVDEAIELVELGDDPEGDFERRHRRWNERCGDDYDQLRALLQRVRDDVDDTAQNQGESTEEGGNTSR